MAESSKSIRVPALTGLRTPTTIAIIAFHAQATFLPGATSSVEMFFVLSGFLITNLLMRERDRSGTVAFGRFLMRRVVRLVPVLLAVVLPCYVLLSVLTPDSTPALAAQLRHGLTFTMDYYQGARPGTPLAFGHLWSLGVEEKFYLLWPPLLLGAYAITRANRMALALLVGNLAVIAYAEEAIRYRPTPSLFTSGFFEADSRAGALFLGCFLALMLRARPDLGNMLCRPVVGILGVAGISIMIFYPQLVGRDQKQQLVLGLAIFGLSAALLVGHLAHARTGPLTAAFSWGPVVWMGDRSYAVYLWQLPVLVVLLERYHLHPLAATLAGTAISLALAQLVRIGVEQPCLPLQRHFRPRAAPQEPVVSIRQRFGLPAAWRPRVQSVSAAVVLIGSVSAVAAGIDARNHTVDDGDIVLRYVRNATQGLGWVWNPGEHRNACTSFLHPALVLLVAALGWSATAAAHIVGTGGLALAAVSGGLLLVRLRLPVAGLVTAAVLPILPVWQATWGLETPLFVGVLFAYAAAVAGGRTNRAAVSLLGLIRPEGVALIGFALLRRGNRTVRFALTVVSPLVTALGIDKLVSGSALPASIGVKSAQGHTLLGHAFKYLPSLMASFDATTHSRGGTYVLFALAAAGCCSPPSTDTGRWWNLPRSSRFRLPPTRSRTPSATTGISFPSSSQAACWL